MCQSPAHQKSHQTCYLASSGSRLHAVRSHRPRLELGVPCRRMTSTCCTTWPSTWPIRGMPTMAGTTPSLTCSGGPGTATPPTQAASSPLPTGTRSAPKSLVCMLYTVRDVGEGGPKTGSDDLSASCQIMCPPSASFMDRGAQGSGLRTGISPKIVCADHLAQDQLPGVQHPAPTLVPARRLHRVELRPQLCANVRERLPRRGDHAGRTELGRPHLHWRPHQQHCGSQHPTPSHPNLCSAHQHRHYLCKVSPHFDCFEGPINESSVPFCGLLSGRVSPVVAGITLPHYPQMPSLQQLL